MGSAQAAVACPVLSNPCRQACGRALTVGFVVHDAPSLPQKYMAEVCPLSCGTCTHSCNDTDVSCGSWAKEGECETNPDAMLRLCPTSCGLCTPECKDLKEECPGWGASGECNESGPAGLQSCLVARQVFSLAMDPVPLPRPVPFVRGLRSSACGRRPRVHDPQLPRDVRGVQIDLQRHAE